MSDRMTRPIAACLATLLSLLLPLAAVAAEPAVTPVEGVHYERVDTPGTFQPVKPGEVEVVEIFAYTCHHCADFAPLIEAWKARQPKDVRVRYTPAGYDPTDTLSRGFFAAQRLGALPRTHLPTFRALHDERTLPMNPSDDELAAYYAGLGVDARQFRAALDGPDVVRDMQAARAFAMRVGLQGTPTLVVGGKWRVRGDSWESLLRNAAALVAHPPAD